jgi:hypothetical protein
MPRRFRRKRILLFFFLLIFIFIYVFNYHSENVINNEHELYVENEKKTSSSIREQFVEIDGKKLRKIDWHDYEFIARENARTGTLTQLISVYLIHLCLIRIR